MNEKETKQMLSMLLAVCMTAMLLPTSAFAQETIPEQTPVNSGVVETVGEPAAEVTGEVTKTLATTPSDKDDAAQNSATGDATPTPDEAQQAFVDAVAALDQDKLVELATAYKVDPTDATDAAFYAEYDKAEGTTDSATELFDALMAEQQDEEPVAAANATLEGIISAVNAALAIETSAEDKGTYDAPTPLTFTAEQANSSVTLNYAYGDVVMYKKNDGERTVCSSGTSITLTSVGDAVNFKGNGVTTNFSNHFTMTGKVAASGDVTSLTNGTGGDVALTTASCYVSMFYDCTGFTAAPKLPTTTLADSCYTSMFRGCTGIQVSKIQTGAYAKEWRIPATEDITTTASSWNAAMHSGTGETFEGKPALNTTYYLYEDKAPPVITGIETGKTYCITAEFTVIDASLATVTANGAVLTAASGKYTLTTASAYDVVATDKSGNSTTVTVTLNADHTWDAGVVTKAPTVTEKGVKTYTCTVCGATKTEEIAKLAPVITEGNNGSYQQGGNSGLTFKSNAALADFVSVFVDSDVIYSANYTVKEGSTIVTLTDAYLVTLSVGKHTLAINSTTGMASTRFTITAAPVSNPFVVNAWVNVLEGGTARHTGITTYAEGESASYTIAPAAGYRLAKVTVDVVEVGAVSSYTFSGINRDHDIGVYFEKASTAGWANAPATGDNISVVLWVMLMALAVLGLVAVAAIRKKNVSHFAHR